MNGLRKRFFCPLCDYAGFKFGAYGNERLRRSNARCPQCGSLERHRLAYLLLHQRLGQKNRTVHVAAEEVIARWLRRVSVDYLSIDLFKPAMRKMDLTDLDLPDQSATLFFCSNVLEHIPADMQAMKEMWRVLIQGGFAVIQVPIRGDSTYEDPAVTTPEARLAHFMQVDHVRIYGIDIADRLRAVGFAVEVLSVDDLPLQVVRRSAASFSWTNHVFLCQRPACEDEDSGDSESQATVPPLLTATRSRTSA